MEANRTAYLGSDIRAEGYYGSVVGVHYVWDPRMRRVETVHAHGSYWGVVGGSANQVQSDAVFDDAAEAFVALWWGA